jgi:hypothetical protein
MEKKWVASPVESDPAGSAGSVGEVTIVTNKDTPAMVTEEKISSELGNVIVMTPRVTTPNDPLIICPYVNDQEVSSLKGKLAWGLDVDFWKDVGGIGSDLAYEYLWERHPGRDVIILHSDITPMPGDSGQKWFTDLLKYVKKYPEAGMFGMKLLYPATDDNGKHYIQSTGGKFENDEAVHITGTIDLYTGGTSREIEIDEGQYDSVFDVPWSTFGGLYIRRELLEQLPYFDRSFFYTYWRDVDYCLEARKLGWKIYQVPVPLLHFEGKDNKKIMEQNPAKQEVSNLNKGIFWEKWKDSPLTESFHTKIGPKIK